MYACAFVPCVLIDVNAWRFGTACACAYACSLRIATREHIRARIYVRLCGDASEIGSRYVHVVRCFHTPPCMRAFPRLCEVSPASVYCHACVSMSVNTFTLIMRCVGKQAHKRVKGFVTLT